MSTPASAERISWSRPEDLPGVEVARAENATTCVRLLIPSYYVGLHRRGRRPGQGTLRREPLPSEPIQQYGEHNENDAKSKWNCRHGEESKPVR